MRLSRIYSALLLLGFFLGIHKGYIALWEDGKTEPAEVYPYRAQYLPEADQRALQQGIRPMDEQQLQQLLEDFLS